jgi:RNA polymerase sigma factor (sigma-70 family)
MLHMIVNLIKNTMVELMYVTPTHLHDLSPPSDLLALIGGMAKRDESSFEAFYDMTLSKVYGLALKITRRHDLAEDVVCDTYWQVWHQAVKFDIARGLPMAWLMLICRSRALDALRKLDEAESHPEPTELIVESEFSCPTLEKLLTLERDSALHIAMAKLSAIQRQLIALAFFKGYTHQEISEQTKLPLGSVKSHIKRAQASLKDALSHQEA